MIEPWEIDQNDILESEFLEIAEQDGIPAMLSEIKQSLSKGSIEWKLIWGILLHLQQEKGYQKGWLAYKIEELHAPFEVWQQLGLYYGYKQGWAYHRWQELQEESAKAKESPRKAKESPRKAKESPREKKR